MGKKKIRITETVLRDAHQSLAGARMSTEEMLPVLSKLDQAGYYSLECWGGATFDTCLRFLNEDPWDRLRVLKDNVKNTKLQMLLRGQNLLGYRHYSDDVVEYFVQKAVANGIDIIRIFDAFNDLRNLECAVNAAKKEKGEVQIAIAYTLGDAYGLDYWKNVAKEIENMGADSIAIKDMSGLLLPGDAGELIRTLKATVDVPIQVHSHCTTGVAPITYMKAIEAGCDGVDTAISSFAMGSSQPPTEVIVKSLENTEFETGIKLDLLDDVAEYMRQLRESYIERGFLDPKVAFMDFRALRYQIPGGMLSTLILQLKAQNAMDKFEAVLDEIPVVREELGQPPLVTPSSQIVGAQSLFNVMAGKRYAMIPREVKEILKGKYGKTIKPFDKEIQKNAIGDEEPITCRPADLLNPELDELEEKIKDYKIKDEDVLTYALFPEVAVKFFEDRAKA